MKPFQLFVLIPVPISLLLCPSNGILGDFYHQPRQDKDEHDGDAAVHHPHLCSLEADRIEPSPHQKKESDIPQEKEDRDTGYHHTPAEQCRDDNYRYHVIDKCRIARIGITEDLGIESGKDHN